MPSAAPIGIDVAFIPRKQASQALARQIKELRLAFPLFQLAAIVLREHAGYMVHLKSRNGTGMWQVQPSGEVFLEREQAVDFAFREHRAQFYSEQIEECEAPKGNFAAVVRCRLDGTVLAPVNHHSHHNAVMKLWAEKYSRMPLERFRESLESVSDETLVQRWLESESKRSSWRRIRPLADGAGGIPDPGAADAAPPAATPEAAGSDASQESDPQELGASESSPDLAGQAPAGESPDTAEPDSVQAEPVPEDRGPASDPGPEPPISSETELRRDFEEHYAQEIVRRVDEAKVRADIMRESCPPALRAAIAAAWEKEMEYPMQLAHMLQKALEASNLKVFRSSRNIKYVGTVHPKRLDVGTATPGIAAIVEYVTKRGACTKKELADELAGGAPAPAEKEQEQPAPDGSDAADDASADTTPDNGGAAAKVLKDLALLLREGYLIELSNRKLVLGDAFRRHRKRKRRASAEKDAETERSEPQDS